MKKCIILFMSLISGVFFSSACLAIEKEPANPNSKKMEIDHYPDVRGPRPYQSSQYNNRMSKAPLSEDNFEVKGRHLFFDGEPIKPGSRQEMINQIEEIAREKDGGSVPSSLKMRLKH